MKLKYIKDILKTEKVIKSLANTIEYGLLSLLNVQVTNEEHMKQLPEIINVTDEAIEKVNKIIDTYRKYTE